MSSHLLHRFSSFALIPLLSQYLGKTHNLWHSATLLLEQLAFDQGTNKPKPAPGAEYEFESTSNPQQVGMEFASRWEQHVTCI